jgi:hypothetical protein
VRLPRASPAVPARFEAWRSLCSAAAISSTLLLAHGCVTETYVIGDQRSQAACADAPLLSTPPLGCTTVRGISNGPYGCSVEDPSGFWFEELSGSWVRLHDDRAEPARLVVTVLSPAPFCDGDAGPRDAGLAERCEIRAHLRGPFGTPCTCAAGTLESVVLTPGVPYETLFLEADREILIEPVGVEYEVTLCATP